MISIRFQSMLVASWLAVVLASQTNCPQAFAQLQILRSATFNQDPFSSGDVVAIQSELAEETSEQTATEKSGEESAANAAQDKRDKERLSEIKKMIFDRRPSAILKHWATPESDDDAKPSSNQASEASTEVVEAYAAEMVEYEVAMAAEAGLDIADEEEASEDSEEQESAEKPEEKQAEEAAATAAKAKAKAKEDAARKKEEAAKLKAEKEQFTKSLKQLTDFVTEGNWERFSTGLQDREQFSDTEAIAIYDRMLDQLKGQVSMDFNQVVGLSDDMRKFMQSMMSNRRNNPAVAYAEKHSINVSDLIGIIRSAPTEVQIGNQPTTEEATDQTDVTPDDPSKKSQDKAQLAEEEKARQAKEKASEAKEKSREATKRGVLAKIGMLLRASLAQGSPLEDFLSSVKQESEAVIESQDIALILSSASHDEATKDFLPDQETAAQQNNVDALNLLAKHHLAMYRKDKQEPLRVNAWQCTLAALQIDDEKNKAGRQEAFARAILLAPELEDDLGKTWLQESFTTDVQRGQEIVAKLGTATAQRLAQMPQDGNARGANLKLQSAAVQSFLATDAEIDPQWTEILNLLAANWLQEASVTQQHSGQSRYGSSMQRDRYGNLYYVEQNDSNADPAQQMMLRRINPVQLETVIETAPTEAWFDVIHAGLQPKYTTMLCRLWLKVNESEKAFPYIETLAATHPETARELAEDFLRVWTKDHNPNAESQRTNSYMFMYGYDQKADKIPLTRSKQERNLQELSEWIGRLRALPLQDESGKDIDEKLLVSAFMTCHSVAEVYDIDDIETVFGDWQNIQPGTLAGLIDRMRANLGGVWRDPNVQRDSKTNRKKQDIQAEVIRGYAVANKVTDDALGQHPGNWQLLLSKACVMHDENDFIQSLEPNSEFSSRRQAAFDVFAQSADAYVAIAGDLPLREQSNDVFDHWFYASLGATELSGISEKNRPDAKQIKRIETAMQKLAGDTGKRHQERFANALFTRMSAVSPACKFRYLEAGFQLIDPADSKAVEAKKVYDYYNDLVTELELVARVDGDSRVGHQKAFGVYVDLRHTKELERESGGFSKYLQNQKSGYYYSYNYGRPTENYRDKFQDAATKALEEHFEVLSVTFNHPETKSRDVGDGWRVTPYAYLLLKARGPEVDKLPALKLDMDFMDTSGYVVLPVDSSPLAIDASKSVDRGDQVAKIDMVQVLDERQSATGKLIVETRVTARGLVPDLKELVDSDVAGFALAKTDDSDVSVVEFDQESAKPIILSERTWTLQYESADPAKPAPETFAFPAPIAELEKITYQRFVDADLEEVESSVSLVRDYGSNQQAWIIAGIAAVAACLLLAAFVFVIRKGSSTVLESESQVEETVTPFGLLTRLRSFESSDLGTDRKSQLGQDIAAIESHYFARTNGKATPDLQAIASRWG